MFVRMVIGEAISAGQVGEFGRIFRDEIVPVLKDEPGFEGAHLLVEDGGNMAISLTQWNTRQDCLNYHSSPAYRGFVNRTRHLLIGDFVVKLFTDFS